MSETSSKEPLDRSILDAHARGDVSALIDLYRQAADMHENQGDIDAACFFLTQALVYALQAGSPAKRELRSRLATHGRETPT